MKSKLFNFVDFYLLLWVSMSILGIFRIADFLSVIMLATALLMSAYYDCLLVQRNKLTPFLKALNILILMFTIYGLLYLISGEKSMVGRLGITVNDRTYLKDILMSLLPIFPFYYFSLNGLLTETKIRWWLFAIFIVSYFSFFARQRELLDEAFFVTGDIVEQTTNNASYLILALIPGLVFFKNKKILFYSGLAFCVLLTLWGMKRGAIISGLVCVLVLLFDQIRFSKRNTRIVFLILSILFVVLASNYILSYYADNTYFQLRLNQTLEGNTSSRSALYSKLLSYYFNEQNVVHILFGLGANGTLKISENYAHNDWLEILINQGAIGFFIYLYYWIELLKAWRKSRLNSDAYMGISLFIVIYLMKTFFSMSYSTYQFYASMVLAYYLAIIQKDENIACHK